MFWAKPRAITKVLSKTSSENGYYEPKLERKPIFASETRAKTKFWLLGGLGLKTHVSDDIPGDQWGRFGFVARSNTLTQLIQVLESITVLFTPKSIDVLLFEVNVKSLIFQQLSYDVRKQHRLSRLFFNVPFLVFVFLFIVMFVVIFILIVSWFLLWLGGFLFFTVGWLK